MKLLYLANIRLPSERAHAVQIAHMCQAFSENGADVTLVTNKRTSATKQELDKWFGTPTKFSVRRISQGIFIPSSGLAFVLSELFFSLNFLLTIRKGAYDILYSRSEWTICFLSFFIPLQKLVWESHEAKFNFAAKFILKKGVRCVCISEGISEVYKQKGVLEAQILIAHDGIDDSFFNVEMTNLQSREQLDIPSAKKIVMYIGGFDQWKGVETFFEAGGLLPDLLFVAIGGKKDQIDLYRSKYPHMVFLGQLPYRDLKHNQKAADVLVIPNTAKNNLSASFTSPLKLFAHMTSKVPLIVSDIPSIRSVLSEEHAYFFEADNATLLAQAVREVINDAPAAQSRALEAYGLSKNYSWNRRAGHIMQFIKH